MSLDILGANQLTLTRPNDPLDPNGIADVTVVQNAEPDNRFRQILAMLNSESFGDYANTPNEIVSDVDSVTTLAGSGVNGPKDPKDIRVKDPRGFE
jgi:hypothetical protein